MLPQKRVRSETTTSTAMANERPSKAARTEVDLEAQYGGQEIECPPENSGGKLKKEDVNSLETDKDGRKWKVIVTDLIKFVCSDGVFYVRRATIRTFSRLVRALIDDPKCQETRLISQLKHLENVLKFCRAHPEASIGMKKSGSGNPCRVVEALESLGIDFEHTENVV